MVLNKGQADLVRNNRGGSGSTNINVTMAVTIQKASEGEVQLLLEKFKAAIANDKDLKKIGAY
jgi:hypothetical protein